MVDLGRKLKELRNERHYTQKEVAARLGVTASVISAYENDIRLPSYSSLVKLAVLYDVSCDYLLGITENRSRENRHLISVDGLMPDKINLVIQLVNALKE